MSKGKLKLAALGGAAVCCLALLGLLFMPTHASADRDASTIYSLDSGGASGNPYVSNQDLYSDQDLLRRVNWRAFGVQPCIDNPAPCAEPQDVSESQYFEPRFRGQIGEYAGVSPRESGENQQSGLGTLAGGALRQFGGGSPVGFFMPGFSNNPGSKPGNNPSNNARVTGPGIESPGFNADADNDVPFDPDAPPFVNGPGKPPEPTPATDLVHEVAEPLSLLLFVVGLTGMAMMRRRARVRIIRA